MSDRVSPWGSLEIRLHGARRVRPMAPPRGFRQGAMCQALRLLEGCTRGSGAKSGNGGGSGAGARFGAGRPVGTPRGSGGALASGGDGSLSVDRPSISGGLSRFRTLLFERLRHWALRCVECGLEGRGPGWTDCYCLVCIASYVLGFASGLTDFGLRVSDFGLRLGWLGRRGSVTGAAISEITAGAPSAGRGRYRKGAFVPTQKSLAGGGP